MINLKTATLLIFAFLVSFLLDPFASKFSSAIKNPVFDKVMVWFSHELTVFVVLVIISSLLLYEEKKQKRIWIIFISFFSALIISSILKLAFMRLRPEGLEYITLNLILFAFTIPDYSFPSTHSAMAFSVTPILDKYAKKIRIFWIAFAIIVAFSRIYLNQHHLSDVVAGSILGYIIGQFILTKGEQYANKKQKIKRSRS